MGDFVQVGKTNELEDGAMKEVLAQGREILLARVGNNYYAATLTIRLVLSLLETSRITPT